MTRDNHESRVDLYHKARHEFLAQHDKFMGHVDTHEADHWNDDGHRVGACPECDVQDQRMNAATSKIDAAWDVLSPKEQRQVHD